MTTAESEIPGLHDFDFLVGQWQVHHRRLKERLASSREWIEFAGTSVSQKIMDGTALVDDNVLEFPPGAYRAAGLRAFDSKSGQWSIWWPDGRMPLGPSGASGQRGLSGRNGNLPCRRNLQRDSDPRALHLVRHHADVHVTGSRRSPPTAGRRGKPTGSWISGECDNSPEVIARDSRQRITRRGPPRQ